MLTWQLWFYVMELWGMSFLVNHTEEKQCPKHYDQLYLIYIFIYEARVHLQTEVFGSEITPKM